jgi:hypothetical protein
VYLNIQNLNADIMQKPTLNYCTDAVIISYIPPRINFSSVSNKQIMSCNTENQMGEGKEFQTSNLFDPSINTRVEATRPSLSYKAPSSGACFAERQGLLYVRPQFTIETLEINFFASLPLRLLTGGSKNKKAHLWRGLMIGIC